MDPQKQQKQRKKRRLGLHLSEELHRELTLKAYEQHITISQLVEDRLRKSMRLRDQKQSQLQTV